MSGAVIKGIKATQADIEKGRKYLVGIPDGAERALLNAFNRALVSGKAAGVKSVRKEYAIRADAVRKSFKMHKASRSDLTAELVSSGENLPLSRFHYKPTSDTTGNRRKQVRVEVKKTGLKPLGQAFVWKGKVMQRLGKERLPIRQPYAIAVPVMLAHENVVDDVQTALIDTTRKRLKHEVYRLLQGYEGEAKWRD